MNLLDRIERLGNALPDPITLFAFGALLVILASEIGVRANWSVTKPVPLPIETLVRDESGKTILNPITNEALRVPEIEPSTGKAKVEVVEVKIHAKSLLAADGLYFAISSLVENFKNFPPLAIVLVGMLGIGVADRSGLISALLKVLLLRIHVRFLTPTVFLVGVVSSITLDAGYVVLPPIVAALYAALGRSPVAGLAAVFAGVSAGFSANLTVTSLDTILAGLSQAGAQIVEPNYQVSATANLWFMIVSTFLLTGTGWAVSAWWVEPRLASKPEPPGPRKGIEKTKDFSLLPIEKKGLAVATATSLACLLVIILFVWIPGAPLHGEGERFPRWITAVVPLLFISFFIPGTVYGFVTGLLKTDRDVAKILGDTMASMGPYIAMAFFAAQFIEYFKYSKLGEIMAISGGQMLSSAALPTIFLIIAFVFIVSLGNLLVGSMSAKYAFFAPVFVPMFMQIGISPELTQAAYRVGDSVTNVITPLNPYIIILLTALRVYVPNAGIGTLVALMIPYSIAFAFVWTLLLIIWIFLGVSLGPEGPLFVKVNP